MITPYKKLFAGIGHPIDKSLGPIIHSAGLKKTGLDNEFLYFSLDIKPDKLELFTTLAKVTNIYGITVTLPHKEAIIPLLDEVDDVAKVIGAVNTVVKTPDDRLKGYNTDYIGAVMPLQQHTTLGGKKVAVIGAGGAAKAFVYGLVKEGAEVTVFNRTKEKADSLAGRFGCSSASLDDIAQVKEFDIICNASTVGFSGSDDAEQSPVPAEFITANHIVFEAVYSPLKTKLLELAEQAGATTIAGTEMLLHQAYAQFRLYYQVDPPEAEMRQALMEYINHEA